MESTDGQWAGMGLFTRLNDVNRSWVYYFLLFGGDLPISQGRVIYQDPSGKQIKGEVVFSTPTTLTLGLRWDGQEMHFYANGTSVLPSVPFSGLSDTFGTYWLTGLSSSLKGHADEFRVSWE